MTELNLVNWLNLSDLPVFIEEAFKSRRASGHHHWGAGGGFIEEGKGKELRILT